MLPTLLLLLILSGSCDVPPRLRFASLKRSFSKQNYFPEGFVVEYDCRPGYRRNQTLSEKLTCLQNFTWSTPDEFCKSEYNFTEYSQSYGIWGNSTSSFIHARSLRVPVII